MTFAANTLEIVERQRDGRVVDVVRSQGYLVVYYLSRLEQTFAQTDLAQVPLRLGIGFACTLPCLAVVE